jgi:hypothetical protein
VYPSERRKEPLFSGRPVSKAVKLYKQQNQMYSLLQIIVKHHWYITETHVMGYKSLFNPQADDQESSVGIWNLKRHIPT